MTDTERMCPNCGCLMLYKNKYRRNYAEKRQFWCLKCASQRTCATRAPRKKNFPPPYERPCPKCNKLITYVNSGNFGRAVKKNSLCNKCTIKMTPEIAEKIRKTTTGKTYPNRKSNCKVGKSQEFKRNCPNCKKELGYSSEDGRDKANKRGSVCNSCSSILYKKSWVYVIKNEHTKKMAATKAGFSTYDEYMANLDRKKWYTREVHKLTKRQPLHQLENYNKLRGLCGVEGAYQLDHIVPISEGFKQGVPPDQIASMDNLQIIPWKQNLRKSNILV